MPAATPVIAIPYPLDSEDVALGAADIEAVAAALDGPGGTAMRYRTSAFSARPAAGSVPASTVHWAPDARALSIGDGAAWHTVQLDGTAPPIGSVTSYAGTTDPVDPDGVTRWMVGDHRALSRSAFAALFAIVGTTYGIGDGSTTFNLPDLRGRVPVGAGATAGLTTRAPGVTGGEENHSLALTEMPSHNHGGVTGEGHVQASGFGAIGASSGVGAFNTGNPEIPYGNGVGTANIVTTGQAITSQGGNGAHNNMPPYVALTPIIRVL